MKRSPQLIGVCICFVAIVIYELIQLGPSRFFGKEFLIILGVLIVACAIRWKLLQYQRAFSRRVLNPAFIILIIGSIIFLFIKL